MRSLLPTRLLARRVAAFVNKPSSMDVAYADAGLTASLGHPILSTEVTANRIPWDKLREYWSQLLKSRTAEGDVYCNQRPLIDNLHVMQLSRGR